VRIYHLTIHDLRGEADAYSFAEEPQIVLYDDNVIQYAGERLAVTYGRDAEASEVRSLGSGKVFIVLRNVSGWYIEIEETNEEA
jgi:hypothetical protein